MLPLDEPAVGLVITFLENALRGNPAGQRVGRAAFAGDDHGEDATLGMTEPAHLTNRGGEIGQVLEHMHGEDAVKKTVGKGQACLAVAHADLHARETPADFRRHVFAQFQRHVVLLLFRRQLFVGEVFPETGPNFERALELRGRVLHGVAVVEVVNDAVFAGQHFMPVLHEVVADAPLLLGQGRKSLGPKRRVHVHQGRPGAVGRSKPAAVSTMNLGRCFTSS